MSAQLSAVTPGVPSAARRPRPRAPIGRLAVDCLSMAQALDEIASLVATGRGGMVLTPNVDHVVMAESDARLGQAYAAADLALVDGTPLLWALRLLGWPVPEKVSGSDLVRPLCALAARCGWRLYLLGGRPGVSEQAAARLRESAPGLAVVGIDAPRIDMREASAARSDALARCRRCDPDLVLVALGSPKGESLALEWRPVLPRTVLVCIGAGLDFVAGAAARAPAWISHVGFEWLYRLAHEPRRLWRRYLTRDPAFLPIFLRALRTQHAPRGL